MKKNIIKKNNRVKKPITRQLLLLSIVTALVLFLPVSLGTAYFQERTVVDSIKQSALLLVRGKAAEINPILRQVEHSVSTLEKRLYLSLDEDRYLRDSAYRTEYVRRSEVWFEDIARFTPGAATSWFRLEKDRFGSTAGVFMTGDRFGGFVSVKPTDLNLYAEYDREHVGWYYEAIAARKPIWMLPYNNKNVGIQMLTYVIPLYRHGIFLGVVGMDIEMAYLKSLVDSINFGDTFAFLLDEHCNVVYHQDYPDGYPRVLFTPELNQVAEYAAHDDGSNRLYTYNRNGKMHHLVFTRLQNGMLLAISMPDVIADRVRVQITLMRILLLMLVAIITVFLIVFVAKKILNPISELTEASYKLSRGELGTPIPYRSENEIGRLADSIRKMASQLQEYIVYIRRQTQSERDAKELALNASRAKSDFLANMSHEIRTPINAVLGMNEMILRESADSDIHGYAVNIKSAGNTLLSLINDILDFSKIEAGKMEIIPVRYDLAQLLLDLVMMINERAEAKNLTLTVHADSALPRFLIGDNMRIKQCILNLLTNAVKYTERGGITFTIGFERPTYNTILLQVSVCDTGIGIKKADLEKLFSPFERIEESRTRSIEGTGLGMSIVQKTLAMMDSRLDVKSEYGKGSEFSFAVLQEISEDVPIGDLDKAQKACNVVIPAYKESLYAPRAHILFVDDTAMNLQVVQGLLKHTGIHVDTAESGQTALKRVCENEYDMLFIDHRMPGMDGIETLHALKKLEGNKCSGKPCIALTANAITGAREMYLQEGFTDYLSKPVVPKELEAMIRLYLEPGLLEEPPEEPAAESQSPDMDFAGLTGIDLQAALCNCGTSALLREMFTTFYTGIDEKAAELSSLVERGDLDNFRIRVHALKSTSRLIGALALSEEALALEKAAGNNDRATVEADTSALLAHFKAFKDVLVRFAPVRDEEAERAKPLISDAQLKELLSKLLAFAKDFDIDGSDDVVKTLNAYAMPENFVDTLKKISDYIAKIDFDNVIALLSRIDW